MAKIPGIKGIQKATLFKGIFDDDSLFLLPVTHPETDKSSSWYDSWLEIIAEAENRWLKSRKDDVDKRFCARVVKKLARPDWPDLDMEQCIEAAFYKKHIASAEHPLIIAATKKSRSRSIIEEDYEFDD